MNRQWPWGEGRAPAWNCHHCHKRIGERRSHRLIRYRYVLCPTCTDNPELHDVYYRDCDVYWHDHLDDHGVHFATRASVWFALIDAFERGDHLT